MNVAIADRLANLRKEHGYTQEQLAERLGVSRQAVSKWERTESSPDTDNLIALAALYGVTLDELIYGREADGGAQVAQPEEAEQPEPEEVEQPEPEEGAECPASEEEPVPEEAAECPAAEQPAPEDAEQPSEGAPDAGASSRDSVRCSLSDGITVDAADAKVHVGWDGVFVHDIASGDTVNVGPGGVHVDAQSAEHTVRTGDDGEVWIDGVRYENRGEAHKAWERDYGGTYRSPVSRFPMAGLALVAYLLVGFLGGFWVQGLALLAVLPAWGAFCGLCDAVGGGKSSKKIKDETCGMAFWCGLSSFLAIGFLTGVWHPTWMLVVAGVAGSLIIDAVWRG